MVQSTITDADAGDTLTWSAMSNMRRHGTPPRWITMVWVW